MPDLAGRNFDFALSFTREVVCQGIPDFFVGESLTRIGVIERNVE
jgi:hypothetical protein